jgi:D-3-phosphoglycerate dehydrogenase
MNGLVVHVDAERGADLSAERAALAGVPAALVCGGAGSPDEIVAAAAEADVILTDSAAITGAILARLPKARAVVCYGIGYDHVDVPAATALGVAVVNMPAFCAPEVANHTLMLVLACVRKLIRLDQGLRGGRWPDGRQMEAELAPMGNLDGEVLGLVGFGSIARLVAPRAQAFGLRVLACDPAVPAEAMHALGVQPAVLDELLAASDYVSLHTPLTAETRHLIGAAELRRMKPTAFLINTGRGAVVDEAALVDALRAGLIAGAGLDVFEREPLPADSPLLSMDNVVVTPHTGGYSDASFARLRRWVGEAAAAVLRGQWPKGLVNPEIRGRSRLERFAPYLMTEVSHA